MLFDGVLIVVRGGGDLASGVVYRLMKVGFPVVVTERSRPLAIRLAVAFARAVYDGEIVIESITARRVDDAARARDLSAQGMVPVVVDDEGDALAALKPAVVVDARVAKRNLDTSLGDAPLVIALGPGFEAGVDCHAVIETNRGHYLGRVLWQGTAEPDTGQPGAVKGHRGDRVLRAPADGFVAPHASIGDALRQGDRVASVSDQPVLAPFDGVLRGLIHPTVPVQRGMKIGDVDPRGEREHCFTVSEKSLAIGGGVLEAILSAPQLADALRKAKPGAAL